MRISEEIRLELKKPLGELVSSFDDITFKGTEKIISIGDISTTELLKRNVVPHLAVFDYKAMRSRLDDDRIEMLRKQFKSPKIYENKAGELSERIIEDAPKLVKDGGAVLIEGEEDLTALAFIIAATDEIIIYGQPKIGIVVIKPEKKLKEKIKGWLASSSALGNEIKGDK